MGSKVHEELRHDEDEYNFRFYTHNRKCVGCRKKPIIGNIYHCILCENIVLCHQCYDHFEHREHNKFIYK